MPYVKSGVPKKQLYATSILRRMLAIEVDPPISEIINQGLVPSFVEFLTSDNPMLKFEAAWSLTNIASGTVEQTGTILRSGAVELFRDILVNDSDNSMKEQTLWGIGNLAGDTPESRDYILECNCVPAILKCINESKNSYSMLSTSTWVLSNLCRGRPKPNWEYIEPMLPHISELFLNISLEQYPECLRDTVWTFSYITENNSGNLQKIINYGICDRLIELLYLDDMSIQLPAVRAIGNITTGSVSQTQILIKLNVLNGLKAALQSRNFAIKRESCWALSNITAGTLEQTRAVIEADILPDILIIFSDTYDNELRNEVAWVISNSTSNSDKGVIDYLIRLGSVEVLSERILYSGNDHICRACIEALRTMIEISYDIVTTQLFDYGFDRIPFDIFQNLIPETRQFLEYLESLRAQNR